MSAVESNDTIPAAKNKYPAKAGFLFFSLVCSKYQTHQERA